MLLKLGLELFLLLVQGMPLTKTHGAHKTMQPGFPAKPNEENQSRVRANLSERTRFLMDD